jgi:hypothetical protein
VSESTEHLIRDLTRDLAPVQRLPGIGWVAASVLAAALLLIGLSAALMLLAGRDLPRSGLQAYDLLAVFAHLVLAAGALTVALASCIPGRDPAVRLGTWVAAAGVALSLLAAWLLLGTRPAGSLSLPFARDSLWCTLVAVLPALVPAAIITVFASWGAPHRPLRSLMFGALAVVAFASLPGELSCENQAWLHKLAGHLLAPLTGGAIVWLGMRLLFRPALPRIRR